MSTDTTNTPVNTTADATTPVPTAPVDRSAEILEMLGKLTTPVVTASATVTPTTIKDDVTKKADDMKTADEERKRIETIVQFKLEAPTFIQENMQYLPNTSKDILDAVLKQNLPAEEFMNTLRVEMVHDFFDKLPEHREDLHPVEKAKYDELVAMRSLRTPDAIKTVNDHAEYLYLSMEKAINSAKKEAKYQPQTIQDTLKGDPILNAFFARQVNREPNKK